MKRYLVFASDLYYPQGGWQDFYADCDTLEFAKIAACEAINADDHDWAQVVDTTQTSKNEQVVHVEVGEK